MYSHLRKYVFAPSPPPFVWIQWLYSHALMPIHEIFWRINFGANACGACIRTKAKTGKYSWQTILYIGFAAGGIVLPGSKYSYINASSANHLQSCRGPWTENLSRKVGAMFGSVLTQGSGQVSLTWCPKSYYSKPLFWRAETTPILGQTLRSGESKVLVIFWV